MISWLVAGFLYLIFCAFAVEEESPFNIAVQTGLAGYIWHIRGIGWLIVWLVIVTLVAVLQKGH
jgi:hypothetical protein